MKQIIIMAYPAAAAKITILDLDTNSVEYFKMFWGSQLVKEVPNIVNKTEDLKGIIIIGPEDYTQTILNKLQKIIPDVYIELGEI